MDDEELRQRILDQLDAMRTMGAGGAPLMQSDAGIAAQLGVPDDDDEALEQFNRVFRALLDEGTIVGKRRDSVQSTGLRMEWDAVRLAADSLPEPTDWELD